MARESGVGAATAEVSAVGATTIGVWSVAYGVRVV
jgi:hypothetical protein